MRTWIVKNRNIDFSVKCKQRYLMELFYNAYPNEERVNNFYKFKQKYRVYSLTDKELENGIQYEEISSSSFGNSMPLASHACGNVSHFQ